MTATVSLFRFIAANHKRVLIGMIWSFVLGLAILVPTVSADSPVREELWTDTLRFVRDHYPNVQHISTDDLAQLLADQPGITILDTREPQEFEVSHIQGAVLAPNATDAIELLENQKPDDLVVVYCSVGYRSSHIAAILNRRGYSNVFNLEGSLFKWANESRPIYRGEDKASKVHPFDDDWGRLLKPEFLP
ncbi:MAG: rhodanese-like domain-containing protein [Acidiferrobacterales bacterium]|nr:rhodanese-like domain-containing protein [Acidiferrobacterales bacterium]